ncbi:MAG: CHAT domain-containing protein [Pseudomonadota bacterium]
MRYHDFSIRIVGKSAAGYDVRVESPAGSDRTTMPLDLADIQHTLERCGLNMRGASTRKAVFDAGATPSAREVGAQLHDALLSGGVRKMYDRSVGTLQGETTSGLRIKLHFDLDDPDVRALSQLPWEFAYDSSTRDYLALSRQTPIVRFIDVPRPLSACRLKGALRILVVMSSPCGHATLDLARERALIEQSWATHTSVDVHFLDKPTKARLLDALADTDYHVLHYMGHGAFDAATGSGALVLEDEQGSADLLDAATLGAWLRDASQLRLIVLNACDTGKTGSTNPFSGVANRLVMVGVPAVLAMQFPISDDAAIDFARAFYGRIADGHPVDDATTQGRKAVLAGRTGTVEWATPVLYMRAQDGYLFERVPDARTVNVTPPEPPAAQTPDSPMAAASDPNTLAHTGLLAVTFNALAAMSAHRFTRFPDEIALLNGLVVAVAVLGTVLYTAYVLRRSATLNGALSNTLLAFTLCTLGVHACLLSGGLTDVAVSPVVLSDYTQTFAYGSAAIVLATVLLVLRLRESPLAFTLAVPMAWLILLIHGLAIARHILKVLGDPTWFERADFGFGRTLQLTVALSGTVIAIAYLIAAWRFSRARDAQDV